MSTHAHAHDQDPGPFGLYVKVLLALLVLTVITVFAGNMHIHHIWHILIAMFIATVKAVLVAAYFMHLNHDDKLFRVILVGAVFFVVVMFTFSMTDIATRHLVSGSVSPL